MIDDCRRARVWIAAVILTVIIISAISCGGSNNGSGPSQCDPEFAITDGNGQSAVVSTQLADSLEVRATICDPNNPQGPQLPEPGLAIAWVVTSGNGTVNGAAFDTVNTDANGFARAAWVLGPNEADPQAVSATALRSAPAVVTFSATATAPATGCPPGSTQHAGGIYSSDETWGPGGHVVAGDISFNGSATLTIAAGAHVCLDGGLEFTEQSHLVVNGSSGNPVIIEQGVSGASLSFGVNMSGLTTPSRISNARLEGVGVISVGWFHPVVIESTLVRDAGVLFGAPGCELNVSTILRGRLIVQALQGGPIRIEATVRDFAGGEGIFINGIGGVALVGCEVTGCATDGVLSGGDATAISVHGSNFFGNGGAGVNNGDLGQLDASGNWWGDAAGPNGPNGDGVAGNVNTSGALTSPAVLGYRPPE